MSFRASLRIAALSLSVLIVAGCDSAEDRAQEHFESGVALLEQGDVDRALIELRNTLSLDEFHAEARLLYARTMLARGNIAEAYANFLRIVEADPNNHDVRIELAKMAVAIQNWEEAKRHARALTEASAEPEGLDSVDLVLRFRQAILDRDNALIAQLTEEAKVLSQKYPDDMTLYRVLIEGYATQNDFETMITVIDRAIAAQPENRRFYDMKSAALARLEDVNGLEDHLRETIARFPTDMELKTTLVRLLANTGQIERAENYLRDATAAEPSNLDLRLALVAFLREAQGDDAALAEIEAAIPDFEDSRLLRALGAGIRFDSGDRESAIATLQEIVDASEPSDETSRFKVTLARMLQSDGNDIGARTMVEEVLADDPTQVDALKMRANWMIQADQIDDAIQTLRTALDQEPEDVEAMTLLSTAHTRAGETELARDLLSLAAEASNYAPEPTLRLVRSLVANDSLRAAEDALIRALRTAPTNILLLTALGDVHLKNDELPRASQVEAALRRTENPQAIAVADRLRLQILSRQQGRDQAIAYLENLASDGDIGSRAQVSLLRARLQDGDTDAALTIANKIASEFPDNPRAQLVLANTLIAARDYTGAERTLRSLTESSPQFDQGWIQLTRALSAQGRADDARATVDAALEASPDAPNLLWAKASFLEQANDIDGAIGIYEGLYEKNSGNLVIANNLASLLATYRTDEASLERAFTIARRLRGTEVPPFQDTYGWILQRRGDSEEALTYLEPAAKALASDPIVQYHLGVARAATGDTAGAIEAFERAVEIAGEDDPREQIATAVAEIERLKTEAPAE